MSYPKACSILLSAIVVLLISWTLPVNGQEEEPSVGVLFIQAFDNKDEKVMRELIKTRAKEFPGEVKGMVMYAMSEGVVPEERDFLMMIAGTIATMYGEHTGDESLLNNVRASHQRLQERENKNGLSAESIEKIKKELIALGGGKKWRIRSIKPDGSGALIIEIDVHADADGAGLTPRIDFKTSKKAKEIVKTILPNVNKGKITWSSTGVALRAVFLD